MNPKIIKDIAARCNRIKQEITELEGILEIYGGETSDTEERRTINRLQSVISHRQTLLKRLEENHTPQ